jgi:hypothetical protein
MDYNCFLNLRKAECPLCRSTIDTPTQFISPVYTQLTPANSRDEDVREVHTIHLTDLLPDLFRHNRFFHLNERHAHQRDRRRSRRLQQQERRRRSRRSDEEDLEFILETL